MLMSLQAASVEGASMELPIPRGPQCICFINECGQVLYPVAGDYGLCVHVEGAVDDAPCVTRVCRRAEPVLAENDLSLRSFLTHLREPPRSVAAIFRSIFPRVGSKLVPVSLVHKPKLVLKARRSILIRGCEVVCELGPAQDPHIDGLEGKVLHNVVTAEDWLCTPAKLFNLLI